MIPAIVSPRYIRTGSLERRVRPSRSCAACSCGPPGPRSWPARRGAATLALISSSRGDSIELPATHTTRAACWCRLPSASRYSTPSTRPASSWVIWTAWRLRPQVAACRSPAPGGSPGRRCDHFEPCLVALEVEAVLDRGRPAVVRLGVRAVRPGGVVLVADPLGAVGEHLVVVVGRQRGPAVPVGRADRLLGLVVVGRQVVEVIGQSSRFAPVDVAVVGARPELVRHEPRGGAGPVGGRAADRLDDPGRQVREVAAPPATSRWCVRMSSQAIWLKARPLVVLVVLAASGTGRPPARRTGCRAW